MRISIKRKLMREMLKRIVKKILLFGLVKSSSERNETALKKDLSIMVPDLSDQYTTFSINMQNEFMVEKVRSQHTFQMSVALKAISFFRQKNDNNSVVIVDIGDSAGTHLIYLQELAKKDNFTIDALSVNLDPVAVDKIIHKDLKAICCRAEELHLVEGGVKADIFMSYEMLEHLFDPISFLRNMAIKAECEYFVVTVPYLVKSRIGLHHIRLNLPENRYAENTHIFELCPEDWDLIFKFSGWEVVYSDRYTQYPKHGILNLTKYIWRRFDFDGFYGVVLRKNLEIANKYKDW